MVHIYNGIWLSLKKEWNLAICNNVSEARGCCAEWNKSDQERQMPYEFTYMRNLKNKINEQAKQKRTHRYREDWQLPDGREVEGMGEKGEGDMNYKLVVRE